MQISVQCCSKWAWFATYWVKLVSHWGAFDGTRPEHRCCSKHDTRVAIQFELLSQKRPSLGDCISVSVNVTYVLHISCNCWVHSVSFVFVINCVSSCVTPVSIVAIIACRAVFTAVFTLHMHRRDLTWTPGGHFWRLWTPTASTPPPHARVQIVELVKRIRAQTAY